MTFDTDNLDHSLAPVLASAMAQYIEAFKEEGLPKHPNNFNDVYEWLHVLEEIHWAFDNYGSGPDIGEYGFETTMVESITTPPDGWDGCKTYTFEITNEDEAARYTRDVEAHDKRVQDGLNLFSKYYRSLWL